MAPHTVHHDPANPIRGSTAATPAPPAAEHPGRRLGDLLRAIGVFADTAFRVVVLGTDGTKQPDSPPDIPGQQRTTR